MRVLIYGGRHTPVPAECYSRDEYPQVFGAITMLYNRHLLAHPHLRDEEHIVVSGGARGADKLGELWAKMYELPIDRFPAKWEEHGKAAGAIRNKEMLDSGIDFAIEFAGGKGTAHMRSLLDKAGIPVYKVNDGY